MLLPCGDRPESRRELRRQAMLAAAYDLFMEKGYEATTLGDIVRRSGGSLATLYELFEGKAGLLNALVTQQCAHTVAAIDRAVSSDRTPREALREIAERMFDKIVDAKAAALCKVALAQPELGPRMYDAGPATAHAQVADYLAAQAKAGLLDIDSPETAAQMFFQMAFGHYQQRLLFGLPISISAQERASHLERVLAAFFKVYGVTTNSSHS